MVKGRRTFSREFKLQVVRDLQGEKTVAQLVREHQIDNTVIARWYREYQKYGVKAFEGKGRTYKEEARIAELERMVGKLTMENAFLKKTLERLGRRGE
jgi:transposase